jgi:hypothetical protein
MPSFLSSIGQKISDFFKPKEPETTPVNQSKLNSLGRYASSIYNISKDNVGKSINTIGTMLADKSGITKESIPYLAKQLAQKVQQTSYQAQKPKYDLVQNLFDKAKPTANKLMSSLYQSQQLKTRLTENLFNRTAVPFYESAKEQIKTDVPAGLRVMAQSHPATPIIKYGTKKLAPSVDIDKILEPQKGDVSKSIRLALSGIGLTSGVPALAGTMGLGGLLNAGIAKFQGQDPLEAFSRGAAESPKYAGLNKLTAPFIDPIVQASGAGKSLIPRLLSRGTAHGVLNVAEDNLYSAMAEGRIPGVDENISSFLIGAVTSPMIKYEPGKIFKVGDNNEIKLDKKAIKATYDSYAKKAGIPIKKVEEQLGNAVKFMNEDIKIKNPDGSEKIIKRWQDKSGFINLEEILKKRAESGEIGSTIKPQDEFKVKEPETIKVEGSPFKQQLVNAFARQGKSTFDLEQTKSLDYFLDTLGEKKFKEIFIDSGMNANKRDGISNFWKLVREELQNKPNYKAEWNDWFDAVIKQSETSKTPVQPTEDLSLIKEAIASGDIEGAKRLHKDMGVKTPFETLLPKRPVEEIFAKQQPQEPVFKAREPRITTEQAFRASSTGELNDGVNWLATDKNVAKTYGENVKKYNVNTTDFLNLRDFETAKKIFTELGIPYKELFELGGSRNNLAALTAGNKNKIIKYAKDNGFKGILTVEEGLQKSGQKFHLSDGMIIFDKSLAQPQEPVFKARKYDDEIKRADDLIAAKKVEPKISSETETSSRLKDIHKEFAPQKTVSGVKAETEASKAKQKLNKIADNLVQLRKKLDISSKRAYEIRETATENLTNKNEIRFKEVMEDWNKETRLFRESKIGLQPDYAPRMWQEALGEKVKIPGLGWIYGKDIELSTAKTRTGKGTDYIKDFDPVIRSEIDQIVLDKYGRQIGLKLDDYKNIEDILKDFKTSRKLSLEDVDRMKNLSMEKQQENELSKKVQKLKDHIIENPENTSKNIKEIDNIIEKEVLTNLQKHKEELKSKIKQAKFLESLENHLESEKVGLTKDDDFKYYKKPTSKFNYIDEVGKTIDNPNKKVATIEKNKLQGFNDIKTNNKKVQAALDRLANSTDSIVLYAEKINKLEGKEKWKELYKTLETKDSNYNSFLDFIDFIKEKLPEAKDKEILNYFLIRNRKAAVQNLLDTLAEYQVYGSGKNYLNKFIDMELKAGEMKTSFIRKLVRRVSEAHLLGNIKVALLQKSESIRLAALYKPEAIKDGMKLRVEYKKKGIDLNKKYGFDTASKNIYDDFKTVQTGIKSSSSSNIEELLQQKQKEARIKKLNPEQKKWKEIGWKPISMMENSKNQDFLSVIEAYGRKNHGFTDKDFEVGKEGWNWVRKTAMSEAFIAHKYNNPELFQFNDAFGAMFQYGRYGLMEINKIGDLIENDRKFAAAGLGVTRVISYMLLSALSGYKIKKIKDLARGLVPFDFGPIPTIAYQTAEEIKEILTDDEEIEKKIAITKALIKELPRNILPYGTQFMKGYGTVEDISRGYGVSSTGKSITYDAPEGAFSTGMGLVFGKKATSEAKEWSKDPTYIWGKNKEIIEGLSSKESQGSMITTAREQLKTKEKEKKLLKDVLNNKKADTKTLTQVLSGGKDITTPAGKKKVLSEISKLAEQDVDEEIINEIIKSSGINKDDWDYYLNASKDYNERHEDIIGTLENIPEKEKIDYLAKLRKTVGGKKILTNTDVDYLYDNYQISKEEKTLLKAIKYDETKEEFYVSRDYIKKYGSGGSGSGGKMTAKQITAMINKANQLVYDLTKASKFKPTKGRSIDYLFSQSKLSTKPTRDIEELWSNKMKKALYGA